MWKKYRPPPRCLLAAALLAVAGLSGGCSAIDRLKNIGEQPKLSAIENPTAQPGYKPVQMPMPTPQPATFNPNSLWRNGSRAFFKDQRAQQVGDILTITVNITDTAQFANETQLSRTGNINSDVNNFFGKSQILNTPIPGTLLNADGTNANDGKGSINRQETLQTHVAAVVTQVLPNGNLVVSARQEFRVNNELRELSVTGVIRPQDIASDNTVQHDRMAEARITYGGRGELTEEQHTPWGQQLLNILSPF
jgi:flagellar L-ring protein precursor FlgH